MGRASQRRELLAAAWIEPARAEYAHVRRERAVARRHGRRVLVRQSRSNAQFCGGEVLALLTREERLVCTRRELGFSSREIAKLRGSSAGAVDTLLSRTKDKLRRLLGVSAGDQRHDRSASKRERERPDPTAREGSDFGNFDDE